MKFKYTLAIVASLCFIMPLLSQQSTVTSEYYEVTTGIGNGIKFWDNSNSFKIHMGNTYEHRYGPVTDYSIKMNMNDSSARGWTWGVDAKVPVMALNTQGNIQTKGWMRTMGRRVYFGDHQNLSGNDAGALFWKNNASDHTQMVFRDKESTDYGHIYGSGDGANFGLLDGDGSWSYLAAKDSYTSFRINDSEKMRINTNGHVGIGTSNPSGKLSVFSAASQVGIESINPNGNSYFPFIDGSSYLSGKELVFRTNGNTISMLINQTGKVRIGDTSIASDDYKLFVEKGILTEQVRVAVKNTTDWADYVFEDSYKQLAVEDVEEFITKNNHLPHVPSAQEVVEKGVNVAEMDAILLRQIEELWLHVIELKKENAELKKAISNQ